MAKSVHLFATIMLALLACVATLVGLSIGTAQGAASLPTGFTDSSPPFVSGLTNPTDMEFAPDGRLFVTEDAGRVLHADFLRYIFYGPQRRRPYSLTLTS